MPYIKQVDRDRMDIEIVPRTPGELNYAITKVVMNYLKSQNSIGYTEINEVLGAMEGAKLEFYRRVAAPYKDNKIIQNGDVY